MSKKSREARRTASRAAARRDEAPALTPAPRTVSSVPASPGAGNQRWYRLLELEKAAKREARAAALRDQAVADARSVGATWAEIGRALGVSRQAVRQRYSSLEDS